MVDAEKRLEGFDPESVLEICREYLAGPWTSVTLNDFQYEPLT